MTDDSDQDFFGQGIVLMNKHSLERVYSKGIANIASLEVSSTILTCFWPLSQTSGSQAILYVFSEGKKSLTWNQSCLFLK